MALTAAQVITQANQIAKTPGYTSQAGQALNYLLQELATNNVLFNTRKSITIGLTGPATYPLPLDYQNMETVVYYQSGSPFYLYQIPLAQWDTSYQNLGQTNYPYAWATDTSTTPTTLYVYPWPTISVTLNLRYFSVITDIPTPETSSSIPWFPYSRYLVHMVATEMMKLSDDSRYKDFEIVGKEMLLEFLKNTNDVQGYAQQATLDRRMFRPVNLVRATKQIPW